MDFISDRSSRHLLRINTLVDAPTYVKSATVDSDALATVPDHLFADEAHREFPLDSAGHIYLSYAYCKSAGIKNKFILAAIKTATARYPELKADLETLDAALNSSVKASSVKNQPHFSIYVDFGAAKPDASLEHIKSGGVHGFYPINDEFEILESAIKLGNESHRLPKELFVEGCQAIYKAASDAKCAVSLPKVVVQYGVDRLPDYEFVKQQAVDRARITNDNVYLELAAAAEEDEGHTSNDWSELWMNADAQHGIKYAKHTLDPYQIFHSGIPKSAFESELNKWTLVSGSAVPVAALTALSDESLQRTFSKAAASAVSATLKKSATMSGAALANELSALEKPVQQALLRLVAQ